jgi:hypothetical protein
MRLGNKQANMLAALAGRWALLVADRTARGLIKRGLLAEARPGGPCHITPAGLRALADAAEAGQVELFKMKEGE